MNGRFIVTNILRNALFFFFLATSAVSFADEVDKDEIHEITQELVGVKLKMIPDIVQRLEVGGEYVLPMLEALLDGNLFTRRSDKQIVIAERQGDGNYATRGALTSESLGSDPKKNLKKIVINNRLRSQLRGIIARLTLNSNTPGVRSSAVRNMLNNLSENNIKLLSHAKEKETDKEVLDLINLALAIDRLKNSDSRLVRLSALEVLDGSLEPLVFNTLGSLIVQDDNGVHAEQDPEVLAESIRVHTGIADKISIYESMELIFYGLSLGSVLLLIATGLAITFGVMGVINLAHGELIMIGAYSAYVVQVLMPNYIDVSILVAIPIAFLVSGSVGVLIQRYVIRFLVGRPLETLLATFGISLILQQTVRTIFSPLNRQVISPSWLSGSVEINEIFSLTYNRLYILIFALLVFICLQLVLKKTSLGLHVRAVSQNRAMAKAIGIRTERVDAMTFGLGSGIAGIAGVALSQLTNVGPNLGQAYIIDSFMVVVFGGVGNLWGTLVGGFTLGVANKFLEPITGAVLANIIVLVFIILFIQKRPRGLFPQKGRAAE